jgi:hypothetical protein
LKSNTFKSCRLAEAAFFYAIIIEKPEKKPTTLNAALIL